MLISTEHDFFFALKPLDAVFIQLINAKMPTIVGILTFMSRINFCEKSFMTWGPGLTFEPTHKRQGADLLPKGKITPLNKVIRRIPITKFLK